MYSKIQEARNRIFYLPQKMHSYFDLICSNEVVLNYKN